MGSDLINFTRSICQPGTSDLMKYIREYIDQNVELYNLLKNLPQCAVSIHNMYTSGIIYRLSGLDRESIDEIINCIHGKLIKCLYSPDNNWYITCIIESDNSLLVDMVVKYDNTN